MLDHRTASELFLIHKEADMHYELADRASPSRPSANYTSSMMM